MRHCPLLSIMIRFPHLLPLPGNIESLSRRARRVRAVHRRLITCCRCNPRRAPISLSSTGNLFHNSASSSTVIASEVATSLKVATPRSTIRQTAAPVEARALSSRAVRCCGGSSNTSRQRLSSLCRNSIRNGADIAGSVGKTRVSPSACSEEEKDGSRIPKSSAAMAVSRERSIGRPRPRRIS